MDLLAYNIKDKKRFILNLQFKFINKCNLIYYRFTVKYYLYCQYILTIIHSFTNPSYN